MADPVILKSYYIYWGGTFLMGDQDYITTRMTSLTENYFLNN